jgi:alpha-beta hydrolase superfamily lysophospholipase
MQDIDLLIDYSNNDNSCEKKFIYGHSLGGNLVINYVLRRKPNITGLIATSSWLKLGFEPPKFQVKMANLVKNIFPSLTQKTSFKKEDLSKNLKNIELYENDDLVHDKISVKLFIDAYDAANWALENAKKMSVPLLLMHGNEDKMTSPEGSKEFASKSEKTELKIWEGFYHEIHNEENNTDVYNFVIDWVNKF